MLLYPYVLENMRNENNGFGRRVSISAHISSALSLQTKVAPLRGGSRPVPAKQSAKNVESIDLQEQRDKAAFERNAKPYRELATKEYHHHRVRASFQRFTLNESLGFLHLAACTSPAYLLHRMHVTSL